MSRAPSEAESWKRMVLRAMPPPAWLGIDAPHMDVVLSSRCRIMRNLRGRRFPHLAEPEEAQEIAAEILQAARESGFGFDIHKRLSPAEREHLVGCRLISPDFGWQEVGRAVLLDSERAACVMVNEEDHLRVQALTAGWSLSSAEQKSESALDALGANLQFAWSPRFGFLSASPFNAGTGRRLSAMFHLIGLASSRRLSSVIRALSSRGIVARGLFGESSRAVGAFVQVSATNVGLSDFLGACEYLRREERLARQALGMPELERRAGEAVDFAVRSRSVSLADALRVLAWVRWGASAELRRFPISPRQIDSWLTTLEIRSSHDESTAARQRAAELREHLSSLA